MKLIISLYWVLLVCLGRAFSDANFYDVLGVNKNADSKEIKAAYRNLAKRVHPDKNPDDPNAADRFQDLTDAYQTLSDPEKRKLYDRYGKDALKEGAYGNYQQQHDFDSFVTFFQ